MLNSTDIVRFPFKSEKSELNIVFAVNIFITDGMILLREKDYPRKGNDGYKKRKKKKNKINMKYADGSRRIFFSFKA